MSHLRGVGRLLAGDAHLKLRRHCAVIENVDAGVAHGGELVLAGDHKISSTFGRAPK